jgi:hypothetical protein
MSNVMSFSYLERYLAGEYEGVWAEVVALGEAVRDDARELSARILLTEGLTLMSPSR